jgi:hypothetical protein
VDAVFIDSHECGQVAKQDKFPTGVVITFQVMAFSRMSPRNPNCIGTLSQGGQGEFGTHATGAWDADDADIGRVFHAANTCQVSGTIAAPVA